MLINIQNLSYAIGERQLYKNLNMIVEHDKLAIIGVNGAGKFLSSVHQIKYQ